MSKCITRRTFIGLSAGSCAACLLGMSGCSSQSQSASTSSSGSNGTSVLKTASSKMLSSFQALSDENSYYGNVFGNGSIVDINVEISEDDWQSILDNATLEEYHSANITVNGTIVKNVGFRTKGFSSMQSVAQSGGSRYGFKVKFDKYVKNQTLHGLSMMALNGSFSDPSYMREYLTYAASAQLGCITPFITYCNLYINGTLFGFYLSIESYNDSFVKRHVNKSDAILYKANSDYCTLKPTDDCTGFDVDYGEDDDLVNPKALRDALTLFSSDTTSTVESLFDVDSALKAFAVNSVCGNYDSYHGDKAHNYYLLYSEGRLTYLGWDYNMSMGAYSSDGGASVSADIDQPVYGVDILDRPLIKELLAVDTYRVRYLNYVQQLCNYFDDFQSTVDDIAGVIRSYVENDPGAFYTSDQFESNITTSNTDLTTTTSRTTTGGQQMSSMGSFSGSAGVPADIQNGTAPSTQSGTTPNVQGNTVQTMPTMPTSGTSNGNTNSLLSMPENTVDSQIAAQGMGGGMSTTSTVVSIVDYVTQRVENIDGQLAL